MARAQTRLLPTRRTAPKPEQAPEDYWERRWLSWAAPCRPEDPHHVSADQLRQAVDRWAELDGLGQAAILKDPFREQSDEEDRIWAQVRAARRRAFEVLRRFYRSRGMCRWFNVASGVLSLPWRELEWDKQRRAWNEMCGPVEASAILKLSDEELCLLFMLTPKAAAAVRIWCTDLALAHQALDLLLPPEREVWDGR